MAVAEKVEIQGTVTEKANGQIVITPKQDSKRLPNMGDEVTITVEVTQTVEAIEAAHAEKPAAKKAVK